MKALGKAVDRLHPTHHHRVSKQEWQYKILKPRVEVTGLICTTDLTELHEAEGTFAKKLQLQRSLYQSEGGRPKFKVTGGDVEKHPTRVTSFTYGVAIQFLKADQGGTTR